MLSFAALQVLNLFQTTLLTGIGLTLSFVSIPTIMLSPSPITAIRQWELQYRRGQMMGLSLSISELILSLVLAYGSATKYGFSAPTTNLYLASSFFSLFIFPFTLYFIVPLNDHLQKRAKEQALLHYTDLPEKDCGMQTAADHNRIWNWGWYNWFRVATYALTAGVNAAAVLNKF